LNKWENAIVCFELPCVSLSLKKLTNW